MTSTQAKPYIVGVDEAGRGPLAGPVTAAAVVLPVGFHSPQIADSKKLSPKVRENLFEEIRNFSLAYSIISVGPRRIEALNIREATRVAMGLAVERVFHQLSAAGHSPQLCVLVDGNMTAETKHLQEPIIKGDQKITAIKAASILAKVSRDRIMCTLDERYPGYGFSGHKGYPTKSHREAVANNGPSAVHRRSFAGVKEFAQRR
ncbi:ribonuclease HII [bacterium J17]|nr:ribonuclease HII [bacterium J17]